MQIWNYIGIISVLVMFISLFTINVPRLQGKRAQNVIMVITFVSFLLFCAAFVWPQKADAVLYAEAETVFSVKNQRGQSVTLLQEVESKQYYVVEENIDNLIVPTYRYYLTDNDAKEYISRYEALIASQNALVNDINTITSHAGE